MSSKLPSALDRTPGTRRLDLDVLRVFAGFLVVVIHIIAPLWMSSATSSLGWQAINVLETVCAIGVPLFLMISGANFLQKEIPLGTFLKKYVLRLFVLYIFWTAMYAIDSVGLAALPTSLGFSTFLDHFFYEKYHLWFLPKMIVAYLTMPVLWAVVRYKNGTYVRYLCIAALCLPFLKFLDIIWPMPTFIYRTVTRFIPSFSAFPLTMLFGYALYTAPKRAKETPWLLALAAVLVVAFSAVLSGWLSVRKGSTVQLFGHNSFLTLLLAGLVFRMVHLWFELHPLRRGRRLIPWLASCTLGIYVIHVFVWEHLWGWFDISTGILPVILSIPLLSILVYLLSLLIVAPLRKLPVIGKWLF